jgi:NADH:ubiquinone reductase (H+-translocating)
MSDEILIVGGGFAGFWAAVAARRVGADRAAITLVSRDPVLQMRPRLYEANPESLGVDLRPFLSLIGVQFVEGEVTSLDAHAHTVRLASDESRTYSRLVAATGSRLRRPAVLGAEQAFCIDTQRDAVVFDRRLREIARGVARPRIAIVGAGFTGIELALELRDRVAAHGGSVIAERMHLDLLDRSSVVGPELGPGPRPAIEAALRAARVTLRLGVTVTALARDRATLADGSSMLYDAVVLTTGMMAAPFAAQIPGPHDELGRVLVDHALRTPVAPHVFVAGDAAAGATTDAGPLTLQSCQHALQMGRFAGENAARDILGMPTIPYMQPRYVTCLDLGRSGAVWTEGWDRAVKQTGLDAKALKRRINRVVIYPPAGASAERLLALSSTHPADQHVQ